MADTKQKIADTFFDKPIGEMTDDEVDAHIEELKLMIKNEQNRQLDLMTILNNIKKKFFKEKLDEENEDLKKIKEQISQIE